MLLARPQLLRPIWCRWLSCWSVSPPMWRKSCHPWCRSTSAWSLRRAIVPISLRRSQQCPGHGRPSIVSESVSACAFPQSGFEKLSQVHPAAYIAKRYKNAAPRTSVYVSLSLAGFAARASTAWCVGEDHTLDLAQWRQVDYRRSLHPSSA